MDIASLSITIVEAKEKIFQKIKKASYFSNATFTKLSDIGSLQENQIETDLIILSDCVTDLPLLSLVQKYRKLPQRGSSPTPFLLLQSTGLLVKEKRLAAELKYVEVESQKITSSQMSKAIKNLISGIKADKEITEIKENLLEDLDGGADGAMFKQSMGLLKQYGKFGQFVMAEIYEKIEKYDDSLKIAKRLQQRDQDNISYLNLIGKLYLRIKDFEVAKMWFERADLLAPSNLERLYTLGEIYVETSEGDKAEEKFSQLMKLSPESPEMALELAAKLTDGGLNDNAANFVANFSNSLEMARYHNNKGVLLAHDNLYDQALSEYAKALKFVNEDTLKAKILFNIAICNIGLKGPKLAYDNLKRCIDLDPEYDRAKNKLTQVEKLLKSA